MIILASFLGSIAAPLFPKALQRKALGKDVSQHTKQTTGKSYLTCPGLMQQSPKESLPWDQSRLSLSSILA